MMGMPTPKPPRTGIATVTPNRFTARMRKKILLACLPAMLLAACAAPRDGSEDSWSRRASDFLDPIVPDSVTLGPREPALKATVKLDPAEVVLAERREVRVIFTVQNTTRRIQRLDFPTAQRIELALLAPDGKRIFLWSEDRLFDPKPATVVINPRERVEYEANVPTRDMVAGSDYAAEIGLVGYPEVTTNFNIRPQ
jgi:hypothetical protein